MDQNRSLRKANLELSLAFLSKEERKLKSIMSMQYAAPEIRDGAHQRLRAVLDEIAATADELARIVVETH